MISTNRFEAGEDLATKPRTGNKRKTTVEQDEKLFEIFCQNPNMNATEILRKSGTYEKEYS